MLSNLVVSGVRIPSWIQLVIKFSGSRFRQDPALLTLMAGTNLPTICATLRPRELCLLFKT